MNNKGQIGLLLLFFAGLFLLLLLGVMFVFGSAVVNWTFDEVVPEVSTLGMVGEANLTQAADYTVTPLNNVVQNFTWITGVIYFMFLIVLVGMIVTLRVNPSRWLMGFFFALMIMLIFSSILVSNIYEDFYDDSNEFSSILKEHVIMSNLIIYSPAIFTILSFIMGIVLFSGIQKEEYI